VFVSSGVGRRWVRVMFGVDNYRLWIKRTVEELSVYIRIHAKHAERRGDTVRSVSLTVVSREEWSKENPLMESQRCTKRGGCKSFRTEVKLPEGLSGVLEHSAPGDLRFYFDLDPNSTCCGNSGLAGPSLPRAPPGLMSSHTSG
jgi:hypothetical protein